MSTAETSRPAEKRWNFNLERAHAKSNPAALKDPLGFKCKTDDVIVRSGASKTSNMTYVEVLEAKAWAFAKSPAGSLFQTLFMFWMSGSNVSIFTLMITIQFLTNPLI